MPTLPGPSRPIDAYKQIIDGLVDGTTSLGAKLVAEQAIFSKAADQEKLNGLVRSLTGEQRTVLAEMLTAERASAIHDVLALLSWWIDSRKVGLRFQGETMRVQLSGQGLHGDYVGRRDGWEWPKDDKQA